MLKEIATAPGIGGNIQRLRERRGLTRLEMAELLGVSNQSVWLWETGRCQPRGAMTWKLSQALNVGIAALFEEGSGNESAI